MPSGHFLGLDASWMPTSDVLGCRHGGNEGMWVDSEATVRALCSVIAAVSIVGVDAEWRPCSSSGSSASKQTALLGSQGNGGLNSGTPSPVAVLQLALVVASSRLDGTDADADANADAGAGAGPASIGDLDVDASLPSKCVFLVDLLWAEGWRDVSSQTPVWYAAYATAMTRLLYARDVLRVGFGLSNDARRIRQSYPKAQHFSAEWGAVVDLASSKNWDIAIRNAHCCGQRGGAAPSGSGQSTRASMASRVVGGLSTLSSAVLGLPIDKRLQRSDWQRRPLFEDQRRYAALDAAAPVDIFEAIGGLSAGLIATVPG
jgi:hypothetical protein